MRPPANTSAPSLALAIVNARVWTGEPRRPWADAVLVRGDLIDGVGSSAEIRKRAGVGARVIDVNGMSMFAATPNGTLIRGSPATLVVLIRSEARNPSPPTWSDADVFLRLDGGAIVVDGSGPAAADS